MLINLLGQVFLISFKLSIVKEKKATSDPDISAEKTINTSIVKIDIIINFFS